MRWRGAKHGVLTSVALLWRGERIGSGLVEYSREMNIPQGFVLSFVYIPVCDDESRGLKEKKGSRQDVLMTVHASDPITGSW